MQRNDPFYPLNRPLKRGDSDPYKDLRPDPLARGGNVAPAVVIPMEPFDAKTSEAIGYHLRTNDRPGDVIKAGSYIVPIHNVKFTLSHDLVYVGELDCTVVDNRSLPVLKYLLHESQENQYLPAGPHIVAEKDSDGSIKRYFYITTNYDMVVRKDKYGNIVCDVFNHSECLGSGGFGGVYPVLGTLKQRPYEKTGLIFEPNHDRRLIKLVECSPDKTLRFFSDADREIKLSERCAHLSSRHSFFGINAQGNKLYGMSIRKFSGKDLYDFINTDTWGMDSIDYDDYFQISIKLFEQLKKQIHDKGLIHRDLKPENILISKDASGFHIDIIDVGCARLKDADDAFNPGTVGYAAYEKIHGGGGDAPSDVFAMALIIALLWRDINQRMLSCASPGTQIQARDMTDWKIGFNLFANMRSLPHACKIEMLKFLDSATNKDPKLRLTVDECIISLRNIYKTYKEQLPALQDSSDQINAGLSAANKVRDLLAAYADVEMNEKNAMRLGESFRVIVASLPETNIALFEFMGSLGMECFAGCRSKAMLHNRIDEVVYGFFGAYRLLTEMQTDLNDCLIKIIDSGLHENDEHVANLFKHINQLSAFRSKVNDTNLDLDAMQHETSHMNKKYRKMLLLKKHIQGTFADALNSSAKPTHKPK